MNGRATATTSRFADLTFPQWEQFRDTQRTFSGVVAFSNQTFDLAARGESRFAENGLWVSGSFFDVLGVRPAVGRLFAAADDQRGCGTPGAVLSHAFWQREFGGRAAAVGETLTIQGRAIPVIGVSAAGFYGVEVGRSFDLALPLCSQPFVQSSSRLDLRGEWWLGVLGRRPPGTSLAQAAAALAATSTPIFTSTLPPTFGTEAARNYLDFKLTAIDGAAGFSELRESYTVPLWLLLAIAGLVLLMACVNLANLLLARMAARRREMAMRLAIGASRWRLVRQLLVEGLLLAVLGASVGAAVAPLVGRFIVAMMGSDVSRLFLDLGINWRVLSFSAALAMITCLLFGLAPAIRGSRVSPGEVAKGSGRQVTSNRSHVRLRRGLVALQITLSLVLLSAGLLFGRSLVNLLTLDAGFRQNGILEADVDSSRLGLAPETRMALRRELLERLRAMPEVEAAATAVRVPMVGSWYRNFYVDGARGLRKHMTRVNRITGGYFDTLEVPILSGRDFDARDTPSSPSVIIVNEEFVRQCLADANPIGLTIRPEGDREQPGAPVTIVGVVRNTKYGNLREEFPPIAYFAESQTQAGSSFNFLLRVRGTPADLRSAVSRAIEAVNPAIVFHFHDFQEQVRYSLRLDRLMASLCGFFALLGAVLAAVGVYGVTAYSVNQRTIEIGVRLALGALPREIVRMVLTELVAVLVLGVVAGTVLAGVLANAADGLVFGLAARDPMTMALAAVVLGTVAILSSFVPALRASRLDPTRALRSD